MTDIDPATRILIASLLWGMLILVVFQATLLSRHRSTGLPLAFVLSTTLVHLGGLVHLIPTYDHNTNAYLLSWNYTRDTVALGIEASVLGILGIAAGVMIANLNPLRTVLATAAASAPQLLPAASRMLIGIGFGVMVFGVIGASIVESLPGTGALLGGFNNLALLGICGLVLHYNFLRQPSKAVVTVLFGACVMIGFQMFTAGILGDSVAGGVTIIAFSLTLFRPTFGSMMKGLIGLGVASYVMVIAAVAWLDIRSQVRSAVWSGASVSKRVDAFVSAISSVSIFDGASQDHLEFIDTRLNHNVTVGKAVELLTAVPSFSANGETLVLAVFGWVPRALWPDKPTRGGSEMVSFYTGQILSDSASFGSGPIFEFFINFGWWGVLLGCAFYGYVLRWLDIRSARILRDGNIIAAGPYFAAGAAMVAPMNNLFFIFNGAVSAAIAGWITINLMRNLLPRPTKVATISRQRRT